MTLTPDNITALQPHEIFVYGANERWIHGSGAAKTALKWGAVYGKGPFAGQTYGICTKDHNIRTLPLTAIASYVTDYLEFAFEHPEFTFLTTAVGTGLACLTAKDIAPLFRGAPVNVALPRAFWTVLNSTT